MFFYLNLESCTKSHFTHTDLGYCLSKCTENIHFLTPVSLLGYTVPCKTDFDAACFQTGQSKLCSAPKASSHAGLCAYAQKRDTLCINNSSSKPSKQLLNHLSVKIISKCVIFFWNRNHEVGRSTDRIVVCCKQDS